MISRSLRLKLAAPSALALLAAVSLGIAASPASAAHSPGLSTGTTTTVSQKAAQKPVHTAAKKKKKKKRKKKRRGSFHS